MKTESELKQVAKFIAEYAVTLLGSGVHTSRVLRNCDRLGSALGVKIHMTTLSKTIVITVFSNENDNVHTEVATIPAMPISFEFNSELSALSWEAYDEHLTLSEIEAKYKEILSKPKMSPYVVLLLVGLANASFCRLFGGSLGAVVIVFGATLLGFFVRQQMQKRHLNHFIVFTVSAFAAAMFASLSLLFDWTPDIALGTSVLFLIPGVPLINGIIDIIEGHTMTGMSRLIQALLLIICVATGLAVPLLLFTNNLIWL